MSKIHDLLVANDKKNVFDFQNTPSIGYPSGLFPLDYSNGYWVRVNNKGKEGVPNRWLNIGTQGGSFYTIIGNSGVGKSAIAIAMGSAMIAGFDLGDYYHIDAEGTSNPTRIQVLNGFTDDMMADKYHLPNLVYVEDVFSLIYNLAQIKINNKDFQYNTGCYDQQGNPIIIPQPTAVLIDSLPSLQTKDVENNAELGSQTYNMRLAIAYNTFYKRLRPIIRDANITVFAINHIKEKPQMGFFKTQAKIQYLKPEESIPGGSGPIYYSQNLLRMIYRGKFVAEKHGFDGFMVEALNIKSKTNKSGTSIPLIFNADRGFSPILTMLHFANENGLIKGRNPYCYFESKPDLKFSTKDMGFVLDNEELMQVATEECKPLLMEMVGNTVTSDHLMNPKELLNRLDASYQMKDSDKDSVVAAIDNVPIAENRIITTRNYENQTKVFKGMHRYGKKDKHNPRIERYLKLNEESEAYKKACIEEMHRI